MKIGDLVTDIKGNKWIIFENISEDILAVYDFKTQRAEILIKDNVIDHEEKPNNLTHLSLFKREKTIKQLFGKKR